MKLIVGLGNIGDCFSLTPHNIGFMLVDYCLQIWKFNLLFIRKELSNLIYHLSIKEEKFILLKPQTYMNLSGQAVKKAIDKYKIKIKDVLIINDDIYLKAGIFKLKSKGGHGGHNGLRNIIDILKTNQFKRLKIGVDYDKNIPLEEYVLKKFDSQFENKILENFPFFERLLINFVKGISFDNLINISI
ncbi:aminoacyl-tRNA hydrolase [Candidatus Phytoplasma pini]|uniref:Peptidyl-tRNA hydrolase n=1 Tax=Candidatus Phytoplasma pini TaxID=267362 RepID=A0A559KJH5_9MOLU|nr:aminoacyl-tRNA hydrolase [Candidatus Phytoplasma pini]TVY12282.1 Peptidyl-tRNA hydrolase [Candidatus Phytoplasma pini]